MTGYAQEKTDIEELFNTGWAGETPIAFENVAADALNKAEFAALYILPGDGQQMTLYSSKAVHRFSGVVQVSLFAAANTGTNRILQLVDKVCGIFRNVKTNNITFRTPYTRPVIQDGNFVRCDVLVNYFRDDFY